VKTLLTLLGIFAVCAGTGRPARSQQSSEAQPPVPKPAHIKMIIITQASDESLVPDLRKDIHQGRDRIERFFGHPFDKPYTVEVFPDRKAFDTFFQKRWGIAHTERWMVAAGVADRLVLLSPRAWAKEADEHDASDRQHVREIITHEMVHVYHGQHNPSRDFDGMDDLGWFVEGLATYVSGQLELGHADDARKAIAEGKAPIHLADAWSGRYRYGVCGSMVQYVDSRYGREMLVNGVPYKDW